MAQKILVIDSSVAIKWLYKLNEKYISQADRIIEKVQKQGTILAMPELARCEIGNAILYKNLELPIPLRLIECFYVLPVTFFSEDLGLAQSTVEIAYINKISYYDASFLALAKKLQAPLITDNPKHQKKRISGLKVIPIKNYR